jgi:hypothetical protein
VKNKGPDDEDKLIELLQRGQVQPNDLDEPFVEQDVNVLGDDLDELVVDAEHLRRLLDIRRTR